MNWQDDKDIFGRLHLLTQSELLKNIRNTIDQYDVDLSDCLSWGQLKSKRWLVDVLKELDVDLGNVFLCAGWYAILANMILSNFSKVNKIRSFDIDPHCANIADSINKNFVINNWKFKSITEDIYKINYKSHNWSVWSKKNKRYSYPITDIPDTIINTSCEHLEYFSYWYNLLPDEKFIVLQSNNFEDTKEHVNYCTDIKQFSEQTPMQKVLFCGELDVGKYTRFMKIGYK